MKLLKEKVCITQCFCGDYLGIYGEDYHGEACPVCGNCNYELMQIIPVYRTRLVEVFDSHSLGNLGMSGNFINIEDTL